MNDDSGGYGFVIRVGVPVWALWPGSGEPWNDKLWWSVKYGVPYDQVHVEPKPADCNFLQAPLGIKGCSYAPKVTADNAKGFVANGNDPAGNVEVRWIKVTD
jgi:hypothetical protein